MPNMVLLVILERVVHSGLNFLLLNKSHVLHNEVYDFFRLFRLRVDCAIITKF